MGDYDGGKAIHLGRRPARRNHNHRGGKNEMTIDGNKKKKDQKKRESQLEAQVFAILEKSLKAALD